MKITLVLSANLWQECSAFFCNHNKTRDSYLNSSAIHHHNVFQLLSQLLNFNQNSKILQMVFITSHSVIHYTNESDSEIFASGFYMTVERQYFSATMFERFQMCQSSFKTVFSFNMELKLMHKTNFFQLYYKPLHIFFCSTRSSLLSHKKTPEM